MPALRLFSRHSFRRRRRRPLRRGSGVCDVYLATCHHKSWASDHKADANAYINYIEYWKFAIVVVIVWVLTSLAFPDVNKTEKRK